MSAIAPHQPRGEITDMSVQRLAFLLLLSAATPTLACTPITSVPITLTMPGTYCFTGDLTAPANQTAITINGSGIALDLRGRALWGSDSASGTGISVSTDSRDILLRNGRIGRIGTAIRTAIAINVVVENLEIGNVRSGISAVQGSHYSFRRNRISGATESGIRAWLTLPPQTSATPHVAMISDNEVLGVSNTASPAQDAFGISTQNYRAIISDNRITGVRGGPGSAAVLTSSGSLLVDNTLSMTTLSAVCISGTATTKAIRNVATNGQPGYTNCVSYDNF